MHSVPFGKSQGLSAAKLRYATINLDDGPGIDLIQFQEPVGERTNGVANRSQLRTVRPCAGIPAPVRADRRPGRAGACPPGPWLPVVARTAPAKRRSNRSAPRRPSPRC
jgi:hypothetical protein